MAGNIYFVTALNSPEAVRRRLFAFTGNESRFELAPDKWMVAYEGSGQALAEGAGIRGDEGRVGTGLVLAVTTYSGRAPTALWDWLRANGVS